MGTDDGKQLELAEARALLMGDNTNQAISATQQQLKQDDKTKSLSIESEKILVYLSRVPSRDANREGLIEQLKIDPTLLIYNLHELLKDRYIGVSREGTMWETFGLMQKGRKYLIDNQLLKSSRR
jgi:DNA-binding MarR family transcriptional regulator